MKVYQAKLAEKNGKEQFQSFKGLPISASFVIYLRISYFISFPLLVIYSTVNLITYF